MCRRQKRSRRSSWLSLMTPQSACTKPLQVCCSVLQCVAVCCSVLAIADDATKRLRQAIGGIHCHMPLQHTETHCNTLQHTATHCNTLHTHCNAPAIADNATKRLREAIVGVLHSVAVCCSVLYRVAVCCSMLQYVAVRYC